LTGISIDRLTMPDSHEVVTGSPCSGLLAASVHSAAPLTDADTVVVLPDATLAGDAARLEITGFVVFATDAEAHPSMSTVAVITARPARSRRLVGAPDPHMVQSPFCARLRARV
jgi:hypothetical protein